MNKDAIILVAVGIGALMLMQKSRAAPVMVSNAAQQQTKNVNNEMWNKLLGGAWRELVQANGGSGTGATPFVEKNAWTGLFSTSDGRPLYTGNGWEDYMITNTGLTGTAADYTAETGNVINDTVTNGFMASLGF